MDPLSLSLEDSIRRQRAYLGLPWSWIDPYRYAEDCTPEAREGEAAERAWRREKARLIDV